MIVACYPVFNEADFIEYSIRSIYPFVDRIIVLDGAVELMRFCAGPNGCSNDGTLEKVLLFPDPDDKIEVAFSQFFRWHRYFSPTLPDTNN